MRHCPYYILVIYLGQACNPHAVARPTQREYFLLKTPIAVTIEAKTTASVNDILRRDTKIAMRWTAVPL